MPLPPRVRHTRRPWHPPPPPGFPSPRDDPPRAMRRLCAARGVASAIAPVRVCTSPCRPRARAAARCECVLVQGARRRGPGDADAPWEEGSGSRAQGRALGSLVRHPCGVAWFVRHGRESVFFFSFSVSFASARGGVTARSHSTTALIQVQPPLVSPRRLSSLRIDIQPRRPAP